MIAFIKGILADMDESGVVLERDGIGYEIFTPMNERMESLCE